MDQLDLLDRMFFQFMIDFDSYPDTIYTNTDICEEYSYLIKFTLDPSIEQIFILSDGINELKGQL